MFNIIASILLIILCLNFNIAYGRIIVASTTSTYDSGILKELNNHFEKRYNIEVHILSLGTGQAIRNAKDGNSNILLVHHKPSEIEFVNNGYGVVRYDLMYNDYIIVGPNNDTILCDSIKSKLKSIYDQKKIFVSRGDDSGTHKKEVELWKNIDLNPKYFTKWYLNVGQGMGKALLIANEKKAYTLVDKGTWISFNKRDNLKIICQNLPPLINQYGIILVSPKLNNSLNYEEAKKYINWIISDEAKKIINDYKKDGHQLFFFNHH